MVEKGRAKLIGTREERKEKFPPPSFPYSLLLPSSERCAFLPLVITCTFYYPPFVPSPPSSNFSTSCLRHIKPCMQPSLPPTVLSARKPHSRRPSSLFPISIGLKPKLLEIGSGRRLLSTWPTGKYTAQLMPRDRNLTLCICATTSCRPTVPRKSRMNT